MKKVFCLVLSLLMLMATPVYAEEQTAQATVTYTCEDNFYIEIPETIAVGEVCYINAVEVNISPTKSVYVDLMINPNSYVTIYNEADENQSLDVYFQREDGTTLSVTDLNLASFQSGSSGTSQSFTTYINDDMTGKMAGQYSGIAMFSIHCE